MYRPMSARFRPALIRLLMPGVLLAFVVLIAACSSDDSDAVPTITPIPRTAGSAALEQVVSLAPGEAVEITGESVALAFHRVANESRCPAGAQCVTAGTAIVVMSLSGSDFESGQIEFIVPPGGGGTTLAGPYTITLLSLEPDPPPQAGVGADEYRVTFSVSKK